MRWHHMVFAVIAALLMLAESAFADTYVRGHTRKDGTYVAPHYRSSPNQSYNDNWSVSPNVNPYTGQQGTRPPTFDDRPPPPSSFGNPYQDPYSSPSRRRY